VKVDTFRYADWKHGLGLHYPIMTSLNSLILEIRKCRHCEADLPNGPRPILAASAKSQILIIGQAPGIRVHQSGVPWDDPSGKRLRQWLGIDETNFYDRNKVAIVPMGFCYPGTGSSGDLPPRPECAQLWHDRLLAKLTNVELTLVIGRYAQDYVLGEKAASTLTDTVRQWKDYRPKSVPLPHPSPRNNRWLKNNPWFEKEVIPYLQRRVKRILKT
jgi:uracil-DNA glycosylase